jgi:site-specific recombinase XerD
MKRQLSLDRSFDNQLEALAVALRPSTIAYYRSAVNRFLRYLHTAYPKLRTASQLRRDPHILGWLRSLAQETPSLTNRSRHAFLMCVRRLLDDLISNGQRLPEGLILRQDFPPRDVYLPQPLSPENDRLLDQLLCQTDDLHSNALRLLRATGMRIGECLRLQTDCLRHLSPHPDHRDQWALHVPLGKLHTERWVLPMTKSARFLLVSWSYVEPPQTPSRPMPPTGCCGNPTVAVSLITGCGTSSARYHSVPAAPLLPGSTK